MEEQQITESSPPIKSCVFTHPNIQFDAEITPEEIKLRVERRSSSEDGTTKEIPHLTDSEDSSSIGSCDSFDSLIVQLDTSLASGSSSSGKDSLLNEENGAILRKPERAFISSKSAHMTRFIESFPCTKTKIKRGLSLSRRLSSSGPIPDSPVVAVKNDVTPTELESSDVKKDLFSDSLDRQLSIEKPKPDPELLKFAALLDQTCFVRLPSTINSSSSDHLERQRLNYYSARRNFYRPPTPPIVRGLPSYIQSKRLENYSLSKQGSFQLLGSVSDVYHSMRYGNKSAKAYIKAPSDDESKKGYHKAEKEVKRKRKDMEDALKDKHFKEFLRTMKVLTDVYTSHKMYFDIERRGDYSNPFLDTHQHGAYFFRTSTAPKSLKGIIFGDERRPMFSGCPSSRGASVDFKIIHKYYANFNSSKFETEFLLPVFLYPDLKAVLKVGNPATLNNWFSPLLLLATDKDCSFFNYKREEIFNSPTRLFSIGDVLKWKPESDKVSALVISKQLDIYRIKYLHHKLQNDAEFKIMNAVERFISILCVSYLRAFHLFHSLRYLDKQHTHEIYNRMVQFYLTSPALDFGSLFLKFYEVYPADLGISLKYQINGIVDPNQNSVLYLRDVLEFRERACDENYALQLIRAEREARKIETKRLEALKDTIFVTGSKSKEPIVSELNNPPTRKKARPLTVQQIDFLRISCAVVQSPYVYGFILRRLLFFIDQKKFNGMEVLERLKCTSEVTIERGFSDRFTDIIMESLKTKK